MAKLLDRLSQLDAHHRLITGCTVAILTFFVVPSSFSSPARFTITWVAFALTILSLMWLTIIESHPRDLPKLSRLEDSSRTFIFLFALAAALTSFVAIIALLDSMSQGDSNTSVVLVILAVACSWTLVHSVFTLRYAHLYYGDDPTLTKPPGGLTFAHEPEPDYLDFAYFSFIIGMTSQTADVNITARAIRRTALLHGVLSFLFNAIIIALTISGLSGMISPDPAPSSSALSRTPPAAVFQTPGSDIARSAHKYHPLRQSAGGDGRVLR